MRWHNCPALFYDKKYRSYSIEDLLNQCTVCLRKILIKSNAVNREINIQLLIINFAFGFDCLKTSIQMLYTIISLPNINMGQVEWILAIGGLIAVLACVSCTMFISANCKESLTAMLISIVILFAPMFSYWIFDANILSSILPSAGIGLQNNLLYQLIDFNYLHFGDISIWTPYIILVSAVVEIPVFLIVAVRSYCKHQVA